MPAIRVRVPATSANLGPGFDCLGLAVTLYNEMRFTWGRDVTQTSVEVRGEGVAELSDADNVTLTSLRLGLTTLQHEPTPVRLVQENRIPLSRGLGSSASAIVAGLAAARAIAGVDPLDRQWLLGCALLVEPHPDNVAAAIHGGLTAALLVDESNVRCLPLGKPPGLRVAFAIPTYRISTAEARAALPKTYSREDVVFSASRAAILVGALVRGRYDLLQDAVQDRIHTPARGRLITGWKRVVRDAAEAGAAGVFISGSGPTIGAFVEGDAARAEAVARAMVHALQALHVRAMPLWPEIDASGVEVEHLGG